MSASGAAHGFAVLISWEDTRATVRLSGALDLSSTGCLANRVDDLIEVGVPLQRVRVDLAGLAFVDLGGARELLRCLARLRASAPVVEVAGVRAAVLRVVGWVDPSATRHLVGAA